MEDGDDSSQAAALQVIVLGSGGGPLEHNTTAFLIRSPHSGWSRGNLIALDAGCHLSAIVSILDDSQPKGLGTDVALPHTLESGPFAGLEIKSQSSSANAMAITRDLINTVLTTHPHLDHISGFVVNTAGLGGARQKKLAGLPSTISAFKNHIFNNVIWPNLSDERGGAGLITYLRLVEGGSPALGEGDSKGYLEMSEDGALAVKVFGISHGHSIEKHHHRSSASSSRLGSVDASLLSPRGMPGSIAASGPRSSYFGTANLAHSTIAPERESVSVYDSSAYFIRHMPTGREVLMFGDVEPDSISLSPRNQLIWHEAAPKIANGKLSTIFIECSYSDAQAEDQLFGHLAPRFLLDEMQILAREVEAARVAPKVDASKKRKRDGEIGSSRKPTRVMLKAGTDEQLLSPKSTIDLGADLVGSPACSSNHEHLRIPGPAFSLGAMEALPAPARSAPLSARPLRGLTVVIIHVKDSFSGDKPAREVILEELMDHEKEFQLGCQFVVSSRGQSFMV